MCTCVSVLGYARVCACVVCALCTRVMCVHVCVHVYMCECAWVCACACVYVHVWCVSIVYQCGVCTCVCDVCHVYM